MNAIADRPSKWLIGVFVLIAMAYVLPHCWWYYSDSVAYSAIIQHGGWREWLHPHHLLLCPLLLGCWNLTASFGFGWNPLDVWRWIGVFSAVWALWLMIRALRASGFSDGWTILAILTISSCWYMWLFSTTPTHYSLVLPWLMLIYLELQSWNTPEVPRKPSTLMVIALTVAVMLHQLAILVVLPILGWRWFLDHRDHQPFAPILPIGQLLGPSVLLYVVGGAIATQSLDPTIFAQWATSYGHVPRYWWWGTIPPNIEPVDHWLTLLFNSHRDLIWATPYADLRGLNWFIHELGATAPTANLWWNYINDELPRITTFVLVALSLWSLIAIVKLRNMGGAIREQLILALMWCAPFVLFHSQYSVQDGWFRLYYMLPMVWILTAPIALATDRRLREYGGGLWALLLVFTVTNNIANGYTIWRHPEANRWRTDVGLVRALNGWKVFDEPGFYYYNSVYPWAFDVRNVYQGEIQDMPRAVITDPRDLPEHLYIDPAIFADAPGYVPSSHVLHIGWAMPDQEGPHEVWIPLDWLHSEEQMTFGGMYALQHYTIRPGPVPFLPPIFNPVHPAAPK